MFIIPASYPNYPAVGMEIRAIMEIVNRMETFEEDEYQLIAGEGIYSLHDSLLLGNPGAAHADGPVSIQPPNPLDTRALPPASGTKLSLVYGNKLASSMIKTLRPETPTSTEDTSSQVDSINDQQEDESSISTSRFKTPEWHSELHMDERAPPFGQSNPLLASINGKESSKKSKKPKNNIIKTTSTFVQKVLPADNLSKRLNERNLDGILAFANVNRSFQWLDLTPNDAAVKIDPLTKILFTKAHVLCHDVNKDTLQANHIDLIMGFSTGDMIWFEPTSQKYTRINKNGMINPHPVFAIKWLPGSTNLFMASHGDGTLVVYDKEKEDMVFVPENNDTTPITHDRPRLQVFKSVQSQNQKTNPVAFWRVSTQKINAFAFSPDARHMAVGTEAGKLFIIDHHSERVLDAFAAFFGGIQAICWSPDGRYILFGGQDDMISIISFEERELVARFQGHDSWITHIAFDPWRCDGRNYRFGSVADDRKLLLWDFNASMLHRPRAASIRQRNSMASNILDLRHHSSTNIQRTPDAEYDQSNLGLEWESAIGVLHPLKGWKDLPKVPAVMEIIADNHELSWIDFHQDGIIAACAKGHIRMWDRPSETLATTPRGEEKRSRT